MLQVSTSAAFLVAGGLGCEPAAAGFPPPIPAQVEANTQAGDPYGGRFPLEEALVGLEAGPDLWAVLVTDEGRLGCRLDLHGKPLSVANFVGLARGLRPVRQPDGSYAPVRYYDGSLFHRMHPGQFVQGGLRPGLEDPGFRLQDEISPGDDFRDRGVLALANHGPNTAAAEFFVTLGPARHLAGRHTPIGTCRPAHVADALARRVARGDKPALRTVEVRRTPP